MKYQYQSFICIQENTNDYYKEWANFQKGYRELESLHCGTGVQNVPSEELQVYQSGIHNIQENRNI